MRKFLASALCAAFVLVSNGTAYPDDKQVYPGSNPSSTLTNGQARLQRLNIGAILRDLGLTNTYADLTITPATGMFVTINPTTASTHGSIFQTVQDAPNPVPSGTLPVAGPTLAPDATLITVRAAQTTASAPLGPITAPSSGNSVYILVEATVASYVPSKSQSVTFVNSSGQPFTATVFTSNTDTVSYLLKSGTPATSNPQVPAVDSGYIPIGVILVPSGTSQITSGMITQNNPCGPGSTANCQAFPGVATLGNVVALSAVPSPSPQTPGYAAIAGTMAALQFVSTATTGTPPLIVNSTTQVLNLQAATAGTLAACCLAQNLGGNGTGSPGLSVGSSNLTTSGGWAAQTIDLAHVLTGLTSIAAQTGTFSTALSAPAITASSTLTLSALTGQSCLGTNGSGVVQAGSCGGSALAFNGTSPIVVATPPGNVTYSCPTCVTSISAGSNIVSSPSGGPTPTISVTNAPNFTGPVNVGGLLQVGTTNTGQIEIGGATANCEPDFNITLANYLTFPCKKVQFLSTTSANTIVTLNNTGTGQPVLNLIGVTAPGALETLQMTTPASPTPGPYALGHIISNDNQYAGQTIGDLYYGLVDHGDGTHGGYVIIQTTAMGSAPLQLEAIQAVPNGHIGFPQDTNEIDVTTPSSCTAFVSCGTVTWTFTDGYVDNAGNAALPICFAPSIIDIGSPATIWVGNVNTQSSSAVSFNYAPLVTTGVAHSLLFSAVCHEGPF